MPTSAARGPSVGHDCLARLAQGTVSQILSRQELKPPGCATTWNAVTPSLETKMAEVLCVYREVAILKNTAASQKPSQAVAIVSFDEEARHPSDCDDGARPVARAGRLCDVRARPRVQTPGHASPTGRDRLFTGKVHFALVKDRHHQSRVSSNSYKLLDAAYPADTALKLILDNHFCAHLQRRRKRWLAAQPEGRFQFTFTPKHGSWLNLIEGFFSKLGRSVLRHIRVASKQELKDRIMAAIDDVNRHPVVHTWSYRLEDAA